MAYDVHNLDNWAQAFIMGEVLEKYNIRSVIEIGSFLGASARFFAERTDSVICIDPFQATGAWGREIEELGIPNPYYDVFVENMQRYGVWDKITVFRERSLAVYEKVPQADLVYIDGDHSYEGCMLDISHYRSKATKVLIGHDYTWDYPGVIKAVKETFSSFTVQDDLWWVVTGESNGTDLHSHL